MSSIRFYEHIETGYMIGEGSFDGRGRGNFSGEYYDHLGTNNPNIQANYRIKSTFRIISVGTNTCACAVCSGSYPWRYKTSPTCVFNRITEPLRINRARIVIERPLYNLWLQDKNADLDLDQLQERIVMAQQELEILQADRELCRTLGSDGMINDCLANNVLAFDNLKMRIETLKRTINMKLSGQDVNIADQLVNALNFNILPLPIVPDDNPEDPHFDMPDEIDIPMEIPTPKGTIIIGAIEDLAQMNPNPPTISYDRNSWIALGIIMAVGS